MPADPSDRLIVALDVDTLEAALSLVERLDGVVTRFKIGSQLFTATGPAAVEAVRKRGGEVFLDLKYHDIPNTVAGAVRAAGQLGVSLVDVHALGGAPMIAAASHALGSDGARLIAVTLLTSHDQAGLEAIGIAGSPADAALRLARLAQSAGAQGVVTSPHEVERIRRACGAGFLIVTPGIRPSGAEPGDQARFATPSAALKSGADFMVVGRPILAAPDPIAAAEAIVQELEAAV